MKLKLNPDEKTIYQCKPHWIAFVVPSIVAIFFFLLFATNLTNTSSSASSNLTFFVIFLLSIVPIIRLKAMILILTDKRVFGRTGIVKTKSLTMPLNQVNTVNLTHSVLGRILKYGTIQISAVTGVYRFPKMQNPEEMQNAIINKVSNNK